jgi:hypothetical protein
MHRSEADQLVGCLQCGAEISLETDRPFVLAEERALCFRCAVERRGAYDEAHDTWVRAPDLSGLELAERPAP